MKYILLFFSFLIYSFGDVFSKLAGKQDAFSFSFFLLYGLLIVVLGIYAILWQQVLKHFTLSFAYSIKAIVIPLGMLWGFIFFKEIITPKMIFGAALAMTGVAIIGSEGDE